MFISQVLMNVLILLAALATATNAIAAPRPQITPPPLVGRQAPGNPPGNDLGDPGEYTATDLGPENSILTYEGNTYHYIEGHTKLWHSLTIHTLINNSPTVTTTTAGIIASTVAQAVGDFAAGDLSLIFSENVANDLTKSVKEAAAACGLPSKHRKEKRQDTLIQCMSDRASKLSEDGGPLTSVESDGFWETLPANVAADAPSELTAVLAVIKSQARRKKTLIIYGAMTALGAGVTLKGALRTIKIPAYGVGSKTKQGGNKKKCDPSKKADENSPLCQDCKGDEKSKKCTLGDETGCPCLLLAKAHDEDWDKGWWDTQYNILGQLIMDSTKPANQGADGDDSGGSKETPVPIPYGPPREANCDVGDISLVPKNVFTAGVYSKFCNEVNKGGPQAALRQQVDVYGNNITPKPRRRGIIAGRTPPPNPKTYEKFKFVLEWEGGDGSCNSDCVNAFQAMAGGKCGTLSGQQNQMAKKATYNTGCGSYSYEIDIPTESQLKPQPPAITVSNPVCTAWKPEDQQCFKDVHADKVEEITNEFWKQVPSDRKMHPSSYRVTQVLNDGGLSLMMDVQWVPGCTGIDEMNIEYPVPGFTNPPPREKDDHYPFWGNLLKNNYYYCTDNHGLGGYTDVGCLRYGFYPNNAGVYVKDGPPRPDRYFNTMNYCG